MGSPAPRDLDDAGLVCALKALADPNRFRMVQEIATAGELSCSEVSERFDLSQPTVSHHLKLLMDAGFLTMRVDGKHHWLSVNRPLVDRLAVLLPARLTPDGDRPSRASRAR